MRFSSIPVCQACVFGLVVTLVEILTTTTTTKVTVGDQTQTVVDPVEAVAFRSGDQVVADPDSPAFKTAEKVRSEWVIRVDGKVCSVCVALVLQLWGRRGEGAQEG